MQRCQNEHLREVLVQAEKQIIDVLDHFFRSGKFKLPHVRMPSPSCPVNYLVVCRGYRRGSLRAARPAARRRRLYRSGKSSAASLLRVRPSHGSLDVRRPLGSLQLEKRCQLPNVDEVSHTRGWGEMQKLCLCKPLCLCLMRVVWCCLPAL